MASRLEILNKFQSFVAFVVIFLGFSGVVIRPSFATQILENKHKNGRIGSEALDLNRLDVSITFVGPNFM